jgi:hypothetical protein
MLAEYRDAQKYEAERAKKEPPRALARGLPPSQTEGTGSSSDLGAPATSVPSPAVSPKGKEKR